MVYFSLVGWCKVRDSDIYDVSTAYILDLGGLTRLPYPFRYLTWLPLSPVQKIHKLFYYRTVHQFILNIMCKFKLQHNYLDEDSSWVEILSVPTFSMKKTYHMTRKKHPEQWGFVWGMIFLSWMLKIGIKFNKMNKH